MLRIKEAILAKSDSRVVAHFGVRWQAERDTALVSPHQVTTKAQSSLRSAGALQMATLATVAVD